MKIIQALLGSFSNSLTSKDLFFYFIVGAFLLFLQDFPESWQLFLLPFYFCRGVILGVGLITFLTNLEKNKE